MTSMGTALRIRDLGYTPGVLQAGLTNSILDVPGVHVSQVTIPTTANLREGSTATKGVTVILPRPPEEFYKPCHAASFTFNGNGELSGARQMTDWGFVNMPIAFTNSLSFGSVFDGIWDWVQDRQDDMGWSDYKKARSYGTPVVGETADWMVNSDTRASRLKKEDIRKCFEGLKSSETGGMVQEGQYGGGAGMTCHQYTGGTGTASRKLGAAGPGNGGDHTLGVLCQSNYGHLTDLQIGGVPVGKILKKEKDAQQTSSAHDSGATDVHASSADVAGRTKDGSILVLLITDAPLAPHQLQRLARHATAGLAQVGGQGIGRTHSGDIFVAISTAEHPEEQLSEGVKMSTVNPTETYQIDVVKNESIDAYFYAAAEATEEAVLNSLVGGRAGTVGMDGTKIDGLPVDKVKQLLERYLVKV